MKNKKRIALLTNHDDDVYCFRKELIESFIGQGYEMLVSCPYGEKLQLMGDINYSYDDVVIDRRGMNVFADLKLFFHYFNVLRRNKPDVILGYTIKPNIYASIAAQLLKIPYINNITGLGSVVNKQGFTKQLILFLFKVALRKSNCIFFQNEENMEYAKKLGMVEGYCQLIPGSGVNVDRYPLQPYPVNDEKIRFNYIGRVLKDKGVNDYIEAAKRIRKEYPNTEFNIIGFIEPSESYYKDLLNEYQNQGIIVYRGNQKDVKPFIAAAHATIHPSTYGEGMSNVLLESASSGRPVITTDIAGCRETLEHGRTGLMYHAGDVDDLVAKIEEFLQMDNETRMNMGIAGRERVKAQFSRNIVINAYSDMIRKIVQFGRIS